MRTVHCTREESPSPCAWEAAGLSPGGVYSASPAQRPCGPAPLAGPGRRGPRLRPAHFRSQQPAHRQVLALPGALARLCAARAARRQRRPGAAPASAPMPGGTAAGAAGRRDRAGEGVSARGCRRAGRGPRAGRGAASLQRRERPGRLGPEGRGRLPPPPQLEERDPLRRRAPENRCAHTLASDSWQP